MLNGCTDGWQCVPVGNPIIVGTSTATTTPTAATSTVSTSSPQAVN
jgi:hypothetical protein